MELKMAILCYMAVLDVGQLQAARGSCKLINRTIQIRQDEIVSSSLDRKNSLYRTANRLYHSLHQPNNPDFKYLFRIARRCDIAKQLAGALADQLLEIKSSLPEIRLDEASHDRFVRNVGPYLLALAHFFECYRDSLASYSGATNTPFLSTRVEISVLSSKYSRETVWRISALYLMLKSIIDHKVGNLYGRGLKITMSELLDVGPTNYSNRVDIFTFGGLEAVKDIMTARDSKRYHRIIVDHFARACPGIRAHDLPASTLPHIDRAAARRICHLLPPLSLPILDPYILWLFRFSGERRSSKLELDRFVKHLTTYEGDEPDLVLEG